MSNRLPIALCLLLLFSAPTFAGEKEDAEAAKAEAEKKEAAEREAARQKALERQAKVSIEIFQKEFKTREMGRKMMAILTLSQVKHDLVIEELAGKPLNDRDPEVRDAVAQALGEMDFNPELAGGYLKKALPRNEDHPEVQRMIVRSLGKLKYRGAQEELEEAASHLNEEKYRWVTVEVVRAFGEIGDPACLPFLLWMAEYGGKVLKWSTGSVTVDTGAAGDTDQKAAEAAWKAKYGHVKPKKPPAPLIRTYMDELRNTVEKFTGKQFDDATEFRKWLEEHAEELGLDPDELHKNG